MEYKTVDFYTAYFQAHPDFKVIEDFKVSDDKDEKNLYVGKVELLNTIHPIEIRVEIPFTFPHHQLTFRTKSLSGYPHLIHTGKIKYGDWFCLNTPFAETAEEQLNQEILRLKEWIKRQLKKELPAIIKDSKVKKALRMANLPEWLNPDEVKKVATKAMLTFIGDFGQDIDNFKDKTGYLHCLKTPDKRFYAFKEKYDFADFELPYIIVDELPESTDIISDFVKLKEYYGWDAAVCRHLLPGYKKLASTLTSWFSLKENLNIDEYIAIKSLVEIKEELGKEDSYLLPTSLQLAFMKKFSPKQDYRVKVLPSHKELILKEINNIEDKIRKDKGLVTPPDSCCIPEDEGTDEMWQADFEENEWVERGQYVFSHFALGYSINNKLYWFLFYTNHSSTESKQKGYNINIADVYIEHILSQSLWGSATQAIDKSIFFGRGCLCSNMVNKKIALVGLGAIGSVVAEILAHSGASKIGLWDSDTVEPGNICRSVYTLQDLGESKVKAIERKIKSINPFLQTKDIKPYGCWKEYAGPNYLHYIKGSFYDNINYDSQADAIEVIKDYDLIIDCTGSNEILHFISYALPDSDIVSLCITNRAKELLCVTNKNGNPFELRKAYLSGIEQDTKNFYVEGSGCYEPTFLARNFDIASLVNFCIRELNSNMELGRLMSTTIFKYTEKGILADRIHTFRLKDSDIILNVPSETILDAEEMSDVSEGNIGYIFGSYSKDGKQIMVTHIVEAENARDTLEDAFQTSKGIIDYIGDFTYSGAERNTFHQDSFEDIEVKANDKSINTNNPLLAVRNPEGDISFFLYINKGLIPFINIED